MKLSRLPAVLAFVLTALIVAMPAAQAQANRIAAFPQSFNEMVMYGDYRRGTGGELAYTLQETIDTARAGLPLPNGTVLVLEIYSGGALTDYFVMEKGEDWGLDSPRTSATATGTSSSLIPISRSAGPLLRIAACPATRAPAPTASSCSATIACRATCLEAAVSHQARTGFRGG